MKPQGRQAGQRPVPVKSQRAPPALRTAAFLMLAPLGAQAADGGVVLADEIYDACPTADPPQELDGGAWLLSPARASRNACLLATCEKARQVAEPAPLLSSTALVALLVSVAVALAGGVYFGWALRAEFFH